MITHCLTSSEMSRHSRFIQIQEILKQVVHMEDYRVEETKRKKYVLKTAPLMCSLAIFEVGRNEI